VVEFKQPSEALTCADLARRLADPVRWRRKHDHVRFALVVSFGVIMGKVIRWAMPQGSLPEQDHFREHFGFDGSYPPFEVGPLCDRFASVGPASSVNPAG
jgi:hypothetical protein